MIDVTHLEYSADIDIGDVFIFEDRHYKVCDMSENSLKLICRDCAFHNIDCTYVKSNCLRSERKDKRSVYFKEI